MTRNGAASIAIVMLAGLFACLEPYTPKVADLNESLLVVEGVIEDNMTISVSRSSGLGQFEFLPQTGATVWVENKEGTFVKYLAEGFPGRYNANLTLLENNTYRLGIKTAEDDYYSEYLAVNNSPAIGDVNWRIGDDGLVEILLNTQDSNDRQRYYHWNYSEAWEYRSAFESILKYEGSEIRVRDPQDLIHRCYKSAVSSDIIISSTSQLTDNIVSDFSLTRIDRKTDARLDYRYSILVRQYTLTPDAFEFWQTLKKNTQDLGTLFGPQPSQLKTNIHCSTNPLKKVIGYISAGNVSEKRVFIEHQDLPPVSRYDRYPLCKLDTVANNPEALNTIFSVPIYLPIASIGIYVPTGYLYAPVQCVDCRYDGGVLEKPDFW